LTPPRCRPFPRTCLGSNEAAKSGDQSILVWLQAGPVPRNFAVVGPPGSGKTTLLKHLTLSFAAGETPVRRTPVLLLLRDHAAAIGANAGTKLADLIEASLKDEPPPAQWFVDRLRKSKCLIMLDGLDEVADPGLRRKVVDWVERQVEVFGLNQFLVSSRPNGYRDNPVSGFTVLRVLPFDRKQIERFVRNWYLANEAVAHGKDDPGVRMEAGTGAEDLLNRLHSTPTLQELAVNPLLLTLIATVHRYRSQLPGRRVELLSEICDVFLGKRQQAKGLELDLTPQQKVRVLRVLAFEMMIREVREMKAEEAAAAIAPTLRLVTPNGEPLEFLRDVEDSSALLVQKENGVYGFAHLVFQEYLASVHIKTEGLVQRLAANAGQSWWHETARLYAAQADAGPIVEACLAQDRPPARVLLLAADCEREALELRGELRDRLRRVTEEAIEDPDPARSRLAAEYLLERRLRDMMRLSDEVYVDRSPVTHAEYQLFIDDMRSKGKGNKQPDRWNSYHFVPGTGRLPVAGIRWSDKEDFCDWLGKQGAGEWSFGTPTLTELEAARRPDAAWQSLRFFVGGVPDGIPILSGQEVLEQLKNDVGSVQPRAIQRLNWLVFYWYARDLARVLDLARARVLDVARALARARDLDDLDLDARDLDRWIAAHALLRLCIAEMRADGRLPAVEGLWLARRRAAAPQETGRDVAT